MRRGRAPNMFTPTVGIGFGAEQLQASAGSTITAVHGSESGNVKTKAEASAIPLKAALFLCMPTESGFQMNLHFGVGYYFAKMSNSIRVEDIGGFLQWQNKADAKGFGFHGGLGFEFDLSPNLALFIEARGRYAKIGEFKGDLTVSSSGGSLSTENGTLYYCEAYGWLSQFYSEIMVDATAPTPSAYIKNVRDAKIDFSGGTALGGLVIKF